VIIGFASLCNGAPSKRPSLDRSHFVQTFDDEFLGPLDVTRWVPRDQLDTTIENRSITSNGEIQLYVDPGFRGTAKKPLGLTPIKVHDGILEIDAFPTPHEVAGYVFKYPYVSGKLTTKASFSQKYGYFEARAKVPKGVGLWPAFWMLPEAGGWPPEIDIFEVLGRTPNALYTSVHARGRNETKENLVGDLSKDFHTYGVLWDPTQIRFYLDDNEVYATTTPPDLNQPCYLILNLAIGGSWAQIPDDSTKFPAALLVDWVRAYQIVN
jgi:serralysin